MKNLLVTLLVGISGAAFGLTPVRGELKTVSQVDGITSYLCVLSTGGGTSINLSHNTDNRTMQLELTGKLSYPLNAVTKINGPYYEVEVAEVGKPVVKNASLNTAGYHINLAFTDGKAQPILTLAYGATPFICQ